MFIEIDYTKRLEKAKLHLAKPNKQVISHISEKYKDELSLKLGNISELSFSIPHYVEGERGMVRNEHVDLIKEKMLIRVTLGTYKEWFVVDEISEDGDEVDVFTVKAFSLGYELKDKRISDLEEESINATELLTKLLQNTAWKVGTVDPIFDAMFRSFESGSDSNVLDCITKAIETFGALVVYDSINRKVSFKDATKNGSFKGMTVKDGQFLNSISRTRTTDEMVTRMWVEGSEGLTIHSVNPTGMGYIENFDYFMYPFERDANKQTIKSSHFMSDALCHAILNHQELLADNVAVIKDITDAMAEKRVQLIEAQSLYDEYEADYENVLVLLDVAKGAEDASAIADRTTERDTKKQRLDNQGTVVAGLTAQMEGLEAQLEGIQDDISTGANFTPELVDELSLYVIENTWKDENYIDAQELYDDAVRKFAELREPKVVIEVTIENLLSVLEEQYYWDKINLGDLIKVKYSHMNIEYMAKIIEINYDLEAQEATLTVANTTDLLNDTEKLIQLLNSNSSATSMIQSNKYKWDKINAVSQEVSSILTQEWDATKNKIIAGVNNTIEVGRRGIIIKNPDFPDEVVIMQSGVIALSKDGGETWKTAIKPDGIVAERLIGQIIAGQELLITNSAGTFTLDNNGARFTVDSFIIESSNGSNMVEKWTETTDFVDEYKDDNIITPYEKKMLKIEFDKILTKYNANVEKIGIYYPDNGAGLDFVTNYNYRYQELYNYLFVTKQGDFALLADNNMTNSTRILATDFDAKFRDFDTAEVELEKQILLKAKSIVADLEEETNSNLEELMDDIVWKIELFSPNGTVFRNGIISTTITATVYRGKDDVTATLSNSQFIWKKRDKNGVLDTAWNTAHANVGRTITITGADVYQKADFQCLIDIPE